MGAPVPFLEALFDAAWERYELVTCKCATLAAQPDLFDEARAERREWYGVVLAVSRELRHG